MVSIVGIGDDGWAGLTDAARAELLGASMVLGAPRHLATLPPEVLAQLLPRPLLPALWDLLEEFPDAHVLASGDPMLHGIGSTIARRLPVRVIPAVSSVSLACARLGWAQAEVDVVSLVNRPVSGLALHLAPGAQLLVLGARFDEVRAVLLEQGWSSSTITVLEHLGGPTERIGPDQQTDLAVLAVTAVADEGTRVLTRVPGLPDDAFETDGQITRREVRAVALAALAPMAGQLLWDVGAGSGSIGIEWARACRGTRVIAVEAHPERAQRISRNAETLGVLTAITVLEDTAPQALSELETPDAIFIGGGVTNPGVLEACWEALRPSGRLVATSVTLESERLLHEWQSRRGGDLVRLDISHASALGSFTGWRPAMPIVVWRVQR